MKDFKTLYGSLVTGDWPATSPKNASGPSASDGTPYSRDFIADIWGGRIDLMVRAGLTPDGVEEANGASQFVKSLHRAIQGPGVFVLSALNTTERALRRLIVCSGQKVLIADYTDLVAATYCGTGNNATAPAFYKCDSNGTRNTSGLYFKLPDCRGLVPRGINANTEIFPANTPTNVYTGGSFVGALLTDMLKGHVHGIGPESSATNTGGGIGNARPLTTVISTESMASTFGDPRAGFECRGASFGAEICLSF